MLDVFFTFDIEIWCGGWNNIDSRFSSAFQQYIYGTTQKGEFGLRYTAKQLQDHSLLGVFFTEPLFATRFGIEPLAEVIGIIRGHNQEVQLHMHPEWVDESRTPLLPRTHSKKQFMHDFSLEEQTILIAKGCELIEQAGGEKVNAFRAGSFGANRDTLRAVAANGLRFDSSYNASIFGKSNGIMAGQTLVEPTACDGVIEYPMTVFDDGTGSLRHAQLGACSMREMEGLLWQALESGRKSFVILSHNFELLNPALNQVDNVMVKRFQDLCRFFDNHRDCFRLRGFHDLVSAPLTTQPAPLRSSFWKTGHRMVEQLMRRRYR